MEYAGFWRRFGAFWIDGIVFLPVTGIFYLAQEHFRLAELYLLAPMLAVSIWFQIYLVAKYGGTPGKILLKIRIVMVDGSPATMKAAILRYAILLILSLLSQTAYIMAVLKMTDTEYHALSFMPRTLRLHELAPSWLPVVDALLQIWIWGEFITLLFNKKRRAVHDFIAGTVVIKKRSQ